MGSFTDVVAGWFHGCALYTDGTIACWGIGPEDYMEYDYDFGQVADAPAGAFIALSGDDVGNCAIDATNALQCWGGYPLYTMTDLTGALVQLETVVSLACAVRLSGEVVCTRYTGSRFDFTPPSDALYEKVVVGSWHACALRTDNTIACWGDDTYGQIDPP